MSTVLHLIENTNIYGGTPRKLLRLVRGSEHRHIIYTWHKTLSNSAVNNNVETFKDAGAIVIENYCGYNIFLHMLRLSKVIRHNRVDVVNSYFNFGELLGFVLKQFFPSKKWVVSFVGSNTKSGFLNLFQNYIYNKIDLAVYISSYVRDEKELKYSSLKNIASRVIYNGAFNEREASSRREINDFVFELLSVGGLIPIKNHKMLIDSIKLLNEISSHTYNLTIVGDGKLRNTLLEYIQQLGLSSRISLVGYQENVNFYYNKSHLYLHPCYVEGFGIAVVEAMMNELPVIGANKGALVEIVRNGVDGYLVDPFDSEKWASCIEIICANSEKRELFGKNAKLRAVSTFSFTKFLSEHDKYVYNIE